MEKAVLVLVWGFLTGGAWVHGAEVQVVSKKAMPIDVIVPAYNEEGRIGPMLQSYCDYFKDYKLHLRVVLNGITDNTGRIAATYQLMYPGMISLMVSPKGKGNAIKKGFIESLKNDYRLIGFVDADGAIAPDQYEKLIDELLDESHQYDGVIASRYMKGSDIGTSRPFIKEYGRKLFYNKPIKDKLGLNYHDYQCGAKLFKHKVIEKIAPLLTEGGWAIDLDILYLCKEYGFPIKEVPIMWRDKPGSHLSIIDSGPDLYGAVNRIKGKIRNNS